jgi:hypothetical protein
VDQVEIANILKSQYHASLAMLKDAIEQCPNHLWYSTQHTNAGWQLAYHTLYFAHLYSMQTFEEYVPWEGQQPPTQNDDGIPGPSDPESPLPLIPQPYSKEEVLAYWAYCDRIIDRNLEVMDLTSPESGFSWYNISKLGHQLVNLRHIQHGAAQLADRIRNDANIGIRWVGAKSARKATDLPLSP